jgi:hypothetical protein
MYSDDFSYNDYVDSYPLVGNFMYRECIEDVNYTKLLCLYLIYVRLGHQQKRRL